MKKIAIFALPAGTYDLIYGNELLEKFKERIVVAGGPLTPEEFAAFPGLPDVQIIFSGWGAPTLDRHILEHMPKLELVLHGAGSIAGVVTDEFWARNIPISSAAQINAIPVAEFTCAAITLSLKQVWRHERAYFRSGENAGHIPIAGGYQSVVGLLSLGAIGKMVAERLLVTDMTVIAHDPFLNPSEFDRLKVRPVGLDDLFARSDVVSIHTPLFPQTKGLVTGALIRSMKANATIINTSRGEIIVEREMIEALRDRPDLTAVLDVAENMPQPPASDLARLPNAILTPHIAGSMGHECRRMGAFIVDELDRYLAGHPLAGRMTKDQPQGLG